MPQNRLRMTERVIQRSIVTFISKHQSSPTSKVGQQRINQYDKMAVDYYYRFVKHPRETATLFFFSFFFFFGIRRSRVSTVFVQSIYAKRESKAARTLTTFIDLEMSSTLSGVGKESRKNLEYRRLRFIISSSFSLSLSLTLSLSRCRVVIRSPTAMFFSLMLALSHSLYILVFWHKVIRH